MTLPRYTHCRLCGSFYRQLDQGCDVCLLAKKNMIIPRDNELMCTAKQTLRMLQDQLDRFEVAQKKAPGQFLDPKMAATAVTLAKGVSQVSAELRRQEDREAAAALNMTNEERVEEMLALLSEMPAEHRSQLIAGMEAQENKLLGPPEEIFEAEWEDSDE